MGRSRRYRTGRSEAIVGSTGFVGWVERPAASAAGREAHLGGDWSSRWASRSRRWRGGTARPPYKSADTSGQLVATENTMLPFLLLTLGQSSPPWTFNDEVARDGRSMIVFRAVELGDVPPRPLHADDKAPAEAKFGDLRLGVGGAVRRAVVWQPDSGEIWLDADGDGRFSKTERHTLGKDALEVRIKFAIGEVPVTRTILLKRRTAGLAYAVRGYAAGTVALKDKMYSALLADGDADGCFDGAAADRVWIDLDRDGKFDPLTEQFPLGAPLNHNGTAHLVQPGATGWKVVVRERPSETGTLRLTVTRLPGSEVVGLTAQLVSEWGELVTVGKPGQPNAVPAGKYRVETMQLQVKDNDGQVWTYQFVGPRQPVLTVEKGKEINFDVTEGIRVTVDLKPGGVGAQAGQAIRVRPDVVTKMGLWMTGCDISGVSGSGRPVRATIRLIGSGSETLDEVESGFL